MVYYVRAFSGAIATAGANEVHANLWNPSSTRYINLIEVAYFQPDFGAAGDSFYLSRTTTTGTAASTLTPNAVNAADASIAPPSGALIHLAEFSAQPTLATPSIVSTAAFHTGVGSGFLHVFSDDLWIPPGTGVAIVSRSAETYGSGMEITFVFED